jgi:hypothetical protein
MKRSKLFLAPVITLALFSSCNKEENPARGLAITTTMSRGAVTVNSTMAASVVFSSGYVVVREVVFDGDRSGGESVSITEEKITTIDLITGTANPPFVMDIPAGTYTSVNLGIEIQDETSRPSVVAEGVYTNATGVSTPLRFEFNSGEVFEANSVGSVTLSQNTPATAKISFDPHVWFSTLTRTQLDNATRTNGVIVISESRNAELFSIVADRLDNATQAIFQ